MYVYTNAVCILSLTRPISYENEHPTDDDEPVHGLADSSSDDDGPGPLNNTGESDDSSDSDLSGDDTLHTEYARIGIYRVEMRPYASTLNAFEHYLRLVHVFFFYPHVCIMCVCVFSCCDSLVHVCYFQAERDKSDDDGCRATYGFVPLAKASISGTGQLSDACRCPCDW